MSKKKYKNNIDLEDKFNEIKANYLDESLLEEMEQDGTNINDYITKIDRVSFGVKYKIIGYGSLMKKSDARNTFDDIYSFKNVEIRGYRRIFNVGTMMRGAYLNVSKVLGARMTVALITISAKDMLGFIFRERSYQMELTEAVYEASNGIKEVHPAYIVLVSNKLEIKANIEPMLTYLSLCNAGAKELMSGDEYLEFLRDTDIPSLAKGYPLRYQSLGEYMSSFNLMDYLSTHIHTTR